MASVVARVHIALMFKTGASMRDFYRALLATALFGAAGGVLASTLSNYLSDVHHLDAQARGWLELPRELPGFLMIGVTGLLATVLRETKMAALAMWFSAAGMIGLGFFAPSAAWLAFFTFVFSLGDHIIFTVEGPIGLKLARSGNEGRRLGQLGGARNVGTIVGVGLVYVLSKLFGDHYGVFYSVSAAAALAAGVFYRKLTIGRGEPRSDRLVIRKRYTLFYVISALLGMRKQIFLVFGTWVLVSLYHVQVSTIALLYLVGAILGVVLRPLMGEIIDWYGERLVLAVDELFLVLVCLSYAFASDLLPAPYALYLLFVTYVIDNLLFATRVARVTYVRKIAERPSDITPTVALGMTIDHSIAMSLPIASGYIWATLGYRWVFLVAAAIGVAGFLVCLRIRTPSRP